jgi:hypothetical protein
MSGIFQKKYLGNIVFGLVNLVLVAVVFLWPLKIILRQTEDFFALKKEFYSLAKEQENFVVLSGDYQTNLKTIHDLDTVLIDSDAPLGLMSFLENAGQASGVSLKITPSILPKAKNDIWPSIRLQILGQGTALGFQRFLGRLENAPYLMEITDVNLRKSSPAEAAGVSQALSGLELEGEISLRVYAK